MYKILFEGIDGCGKDTQLSILKERLARTRRTVATVKHPGYTPFGRQIRNLILGGEQPAADMARRVLFWADFLDTAANLPSVDVVIFNRHPLLSNVAYGVASGTPRHLLEELSRTFMPLAPEAKPDLVFVIDIPVDEAYRRIYQRGKPLTKVEENGSEFMEKVRAVYLDIAAQTPNVHLVNGMNDPEDVAAEVYAKLQQALAQPDQSEGRCGCGGTICWIDHRTKMDVDIVSDDRIRVALIGECDACGQAHRGIFDGRLEKFVDLL